MNGSVFLIICGMTLVTYIPRALPAALVDKLHFPPRVEKFLRLIPYGKCQVVNAGKGKYF